jgi:hypothetical protein
LLVALVAKVELPVEAELADIEQELYHYQWHLTQLP